MGQILSNPVIDKEHHSGADLLTAFGLCAMQGWRMSMEDAHIVEPNVLPETDDEHIAFYSIFDGHGGSAVAQFCGSKMVSILTSQESFKEKKLKQALIDTYLKTDEELLKDPEMRNDHSGCTATSILVSKLQQTLVCGNSGDSRTVLSINGVAKALSFDHKPTLTSERSRIVAADGFVEMDRVNGNLALSRAIGDFEFKSNDKLGPHEQIVTCVPDIVEHRLNYDNDEFVILACDGIWDCLSSQECVDLVHHGIMKGDMTLNDISSRIIDVCCSPTTEGTGIGCDNVSIVVVALLKENETINAWFERMRNKGYKPPHSFEEQRRSIFSYYQFPEDDEKVFDVTTKKPQDRFNQDSEISTGDEDERNKMEIDEDDNDRSGAQKKTGASIPVDLLSLEALLNGAGNIQLNQGPDNVSYISGSSLTDMINSLSRAAAMANNTRDSDSEEEDTKIIEDVSDKQE